jgi:hypothetical protein
MGGGWRQQSSKQDAELPQPLQHHLHSYLFTSNEMMQFNSTTTFHDTCLFVLVSVRVALVAVGGDERSDPLIKKGQRGRWCSEK